MAESYLDLKCAASRGVRASRVWPSRTGGIHLTWFVGNQALRPAGLVELAAGAAITGWCLWHAVRRAGLSTGWLVAAVVITAAALTLGAGVLIEAASSTRDAGSARSGPVDEGEP